jgi:hypothetical protein
MIQHVVVIRFVPDAPASAVRAFADAVIRLPEAIPEVVDFVCGPDINKVLGGEFADNWDFVVMATFANVDDYQTYASHPAHASLKETYLTGLLQDRAGLQMVLDPAIVGKAGR